MARRLTGAALAAGLVLACTRGDERLGPLVLISVDTLRADRLGAYGSELGLSPRLDALAAESQLFEWSYAPSAYTLPSVSAMLTSRYGEETGMRVAGSVLPKRIPTLATLLHARGWATGAVVSNSVLEHQFGFDQGFEHYDDTYPQMEANRPQPERVARDTTDAALAMLDTLRGWDRRAFFLWVHYQDPHGPYTPPGDLSRLALAAERARPDGTKTLEIGANNVGLGSIPPYQRLGEAREVAVYRAAYAGEVRYADAEIGRLLDGLRERGVWEHAVLVFTADHGEGLGEDDYWFAHGELLTDPLVRVPLWIRVPGRPGRRHPGPASLLDVVPTLAGLLDFPLPDGARGRDLLAPAPAGPTEPIYLAALNHSSLPRFGLVTGEYRYLVTLVGEARAEQLFRLGEEQDLAAREPDELERLRKKLVEVRASLARPPRARTRGLTERERANLRALGYLE